MPSVHESVSPQNDTPLMLRIWSKEKFLELKKSISEKEKIKGVELFYRPDLDMIRLSHKDIDALPYITTKYMCENVRVFNS